MKPICPVFVVCYIIKLMDKKLGKPYRLIVLLLLLSLFLWTGCIYIDTPSQTPPSPPPPEVSAPTNPAWTLPTPPVESNNPPLPDFVSVVAKVKPAVVAISTSVVVNNPFFGRSTQEGAGSGWIIDKEGHIVTNNHVIDGAQSITVTLADGRALEAGVVGTDALNDLAVLKVEGADLPTSQIGDSTKLQNGEWVLAIGNALGRGISVKEGIVSRLDVTVQVGAGQSLFDLIETSAAINPGNSGGPLVNMAGEVIGITSVKLAALEVEGVGYAISVNTATPIIEELIQKGYVVRPWLGVVVGTVNPSVAKMRNLSVDKGALIMEVASDSPADKAGLQENDVIVSMGGKEIIGAAEMVRAIHDNQIGEEIEVIYWRGDTQNTTTIILSESPPPP